MKEWQEGVKCSKKQKERKDPDRKQNIESVKVRKKASKNEESKQESKQERRKQERKKKR